MPLSHLKFTAPAEKVISKIATCEALLQKGDSLKNCTLQGLDLRPLQYNWASIEIEDTLFLGCQLDLEDEFVLRKKGATIISAPTNLPYLPFRSQLYTWQELLKPSAAPNTSNDLAIYDHFSRSRFKLNINEALWQRIHDHAIDDALREMLEFDERGMTQRKCVAIMGGHGTLRTSPDYEKTVRTAKLMGEAGYFIASGGGPGIMEAANLGAYLAGKPDSILPKIFKILAKAPSYNDLGFNDCALEVLALIGDGPDNLAIPTWFYGHEPSNIFATHIAKYFSNSIREDTLLAIALYGIVFAPGSAGTTQEIFMDAAQNHYATFNYYSPMIFLGRQRYEIDTLIFPLLKQLSHGKPYHDMLFLTDEPNEVLGFLQKHTPLEA